MAAVNLNPVCPDGETIEHVQKLFEYSKKQHITCSNTIPPVIPLGSAPQGFRSQSPRYAISTVSGAGRFRIPETCETAHGRHAIGRTAKKQLFSVFLLRLCLFAFVF